MDYLPERIQSLGINRPTVLVDKEKVLRNIERMLDKAKSAGVAFRPHFKTHQSLEIGQLFRERGVKSITVSSLDMAKYFADNGWKNITVAFPVNLPEIEKINLLAKGVTLNLLVDSEPVVRKLDNSLNAPVTIWVKIDVGYKRVGIIWEDTDTIKSIVESIGKAPRMAFVGILTHSGHSYNAGSRSKITEIHSTSISRMLDVKHELEHQGFGPCAVSIGDTPCCSVAESFEGVDEIRPGNFVFYDLKQAELGSCSEEDIAVVVACPVVSKNRERKQIIIYGGAVHFSKDFITDKNQQMVFGYVASCNNKTWVHIEKNMPVISLSQEHGVIEVPDGLFEDIGIGDILLIYPIHSCLTCDLYSEYRTLEGEKISRNLSNCVLGW